MAFIGYGDSDRSALRISGEQIERHLAAALEQLYRRIAQTPAASRFFEGEEHVKRAKAAQLRHWQSFTLDKIDAAYVANVRRIAEAHARLGLEPRWYIGAYAILLEHMTRSLLEPGKPGWAKKPKTERELQLVGAIIKAVFLDMDYSLSVYLDVADQRAEAERRKAVAAGDALSAEQQRAEAAAREIMARNSADLRRAMDIVRPALKRLSDGDVSWRIDEALPEGYRDLQDALNSAIAKMRTTIETIKGGAAAVSSSASEMAAAADDLSRRTEQQAANLEQASAAIEQISDSVIETARSAKGAAAVVEQAHKLAAEGGGVIDRTTAAMSAIQRSSNEISKIIGVIDEIAFQTNLLALNAGVEAARAGEAGRGFSVVASEVRNLAQRSAEAAKEIKSLIAGSSRQVEEGVHLVSETGQVLKQIVSHVGEMTSVVGEIAKSGSEQATSISEIATAIRQLDMITQQNAAIVEETTAASRKLDEEADRLLTLTGQFRLESAQSLAQMSARGRRAI